MGSTIRSGTSTLAKVGAGVLLGVALTSWIAPNAGPTERLASHEAVVPADGRAGTVEAAGRSAAETSALAERTSSAPKPSLALVPYVRPEDTILDFGQVPPRVALRKVFLLHNDGGKPLRIRKAKPSCGCAAVKFDKEIPAGGVGSFEVAISEASVRPGKLSHHIELETNDPNTWLLLIEADVDPALGSLFGDQSSLLPDAGLLIR